jgi:predicted RNase H-like nuclease (RuvC/YqgF family)
MHDDHRSRMSDGQPQRTLVAIDPGHTTGIAIFHDDELVHVLTSESPHEALGDIVRDKEVVCEQGPVNRDHNADACVEVETIVKQESATTHWVRPADWKCHPASRTEPKEGNRHERDAIGMGRVFLVLRKRPGAAVA